MKLKTFMATALAGILGSSTFASAKTEYILKPDRWNGGTVGLGNLKGGGGGKFTLNVNADQNIFFNILSSSTSWASGIIFDRSSYSSLNLSSTTMEFGTIFSSSHVATGIKNQFNNLDLYLRDKSAVDIAFLANIVGNLQASGFWLDNSAFALKTGTISFEESITATNGIASGFYVVGQSRSGSVEISSAYAEAAQVKINKITGREAYGLLYEINHNGNNLTIDSGLYLNHNERGGIFINSIQSANGNAALLMSYGNTSITLNNLAVMKVGSINSASQAYGIAINDGNASIFLNKGSLLSIDSLTAQRGAYGFYVAGNNYSGAYFTLKTSDGAMASINNISSKTNDAYGILTDKSLTLEAYQDTSAIKFGTILSLQGNAYGIKSHSYSRLNALNGGKIIFETIKGQNAYGIQSNYDVILKPQGNGQITFKTIRAEGSNGARAVGIDSGSTIQISPEIGGSLIFENISSKSEANGIRVASSLRIDHTKDPYQSGKAAATIFKNISSEGHNAIGIYASRGAVLGFYGGGRTTFENITYEGSNAYTAAGLIVDSNLTSVAIEKGHEVRFNNIASSNVAFGLKTSSLNLQVNGGGSLLQVGTVTANGEATGIYAQNQLQLQAYQDTSAIKFGTILSSQGNAYGIKANSSELNALNGGKIIFETIKGQNAYGIQSNYDVILKPQGNGQITFKTIRAEGSNGARAVGIDSGSTIQISPEIGGSLIFENISSKSEANGIRVASSLRIDHTKDPYQSGKAAATIFKNISSEGHNAIGIYASRGAVLGFYGGGRTTFENITYEGSNAYTAAGLIVDSNLTSVAIEKGHEVRFNNIASSNVAFGLKTSSLNLQVNGGGSLLQVGTVTANGEATGIYAQNQLQLQALGGGKLVFQNVYSTRAKAGGIEGNSMAISVTGNGGIVFERVSSGAGVNGIRVGSKLDVDLSKASVADSLVFKSIVAQNGNALGIYAPNGASITFKGSGSNAAFKNIAHQGASTSNFASGIVSDGSNLNLSVINGNHLWFDSIASTHGSAYGFRTRSMQLNVDSSSSIRFINISSGNQSAGIWINDGSTVNISGGGKIEFRDISSKGNKLGIRAWSSKFTLTNTSLIFGKTNTSNKYGIYSGINDLKHTFGDANISVQGQNAVAIYGASNTTIELQSGKTMTLSAKNGNIETMAIDGKVNFALKGANSSLVFDSGSGNIQRLDVANGSNINLIGLSSRNSNNLQLRKITVESWNGSGANVLLYANGTATINTSSFDGRAYKPSKEMAWYGGSDRIVINGTNTSSTQNNTLKVALDTVDNPVKYVILAEVGGNAKNSVVFNGLNSDKSRTTIQTEVGFDQGTIEIARYDTVDKAYYVGKIPDKASFRLNQQKARGVGEAQNSSATIVLANFNNLNKRMGELRENPNSQGVWTRVFNGEVSSDFGSGSTLNYTTIQAGYDYNLSKNTDANSYLGIALAYLNSKTDNAISDTTGNGVEVGAYFAYVKDNGLYTDSIVKVAYISNNNSGINSKGYSLTDTSVTSIVLSQEIGYQAKIGNSGFYLTPQFETTFAYLGGSEMTTVLNGNSMKSTQDAISDWRNRFGLQASYKLIDSDNKFNASFYAKGSYAYDYISGGDTTYKTSISSETLASSMKSDGRFVFNIGSNINIKDTARLYIDFEKSVGGRINTNYQINVGVRYSFGEKNISK